LKRGGSPIGDDCHIRFGATAFARLRVLVIRGDKLGQKGSVVKARRAIATMSCARQRNQRPAFSGRLGAICAPGYVTLPSKHGSSVSIKDVSTVSAPDGQVACRALLT
jgi:hypothetical protein